MRPDILNRGYGPGTKLLFAHIRLFSGHPLRMLGKLTADGTLSAGDMREVLSAGVSRQQAADALAVCAAFNTTGRLADAFSFEVLSPEGFEAGATYLLKRGYR